MAEPKELSAERIEEAERLLAKLSTMSSEQLGKCLFVNLFPRLLAKEGSIFHRVHDAIIEEGKRRSRKEEDLH